MTHDTFKSPDLKIERAIASKVGIIEQISEVVHTNVFADDCYMFSSQSGDLSQLFPDRDFRPERGTTPRVYGSGCDPDREIAHRKAVFEALERYATAVYSDADIVVGSAKSLGDRTLRIELMPEMSVRGHTTDIWTKRAFDPNDPMRWVNGYSVGQKRTVLVPLVMAHIYVAAWPSEQFCFQSTTGVAAQTSYHAALESAILEAIERDATQTVWSLRLPLPLLSFDDGAISADLARFAMQDDVDYVEQYYFDATRDLGIPTVYSVRQIRKPLGEAVIVNCASDYCLPGAALRARKEASSVLLTNLHANADFGMPVGAQRFPYYRSLESFQFLWSGRQREIAAAQGKLPSTPELRAAWLIETLSKAGHDVVIMNLTTDELEALGVFVVRALIPTLMPLSPDINCQYRSHSRLAELSKWMGQEHLSEDDLNVLQQPFI